MFPRVSIIMLNYNGLSDTLECLESLKKCSYPNFEILLLDNGSTEDQVKALQEVKMERLRFIDNKKNLGFAGGNNVGIRMVLDEKKSAYIYFLNNDTVIEPDFLERAIERAEGDNMIGIVASLSLQYSSRELVENAGHYLLDCGDSTPRGRNVPKENMQESCELLGACSANALYRVEALRECGMYDEEFFLNYEDADLSLRCILYGWKCVYEPKSIIYHKVSVSIKKIRNYEFNVRSQVNQMKSYFYNMPLIVIVLNSPFIVLRDIFVLLTNLVFFKWIIVKTILHSKLVFLSQIGKILRTRSERMKHKKISWRYIWCKQKSFVPFYWNYFVEIILRRNKSVLE
jgi:GT2 family glycosyltransferase